MNHRMMIGSLVVVAALAGACAGGDDDDTARIDTVDSDSTSDDDGTTTTEPPDDSANDDEADDQTEDEQEADEPEPALLLIMDSSGSMNAEGPDGQPLIAGAKQALRDVIGGLPDDQSVGLRVYGHTVPNTDEENGCVDTELIHPVEPLDREALLSAIDGYQAKGYTPIELSLREGMDDLPPEGPRTMVLVSDGEETCDGDPCQAAEDLAAEGIDLVIHTVGFALDDNDPARDQLSCIAEAGGGEFVDVAEADELADAIDEVARAGREADLDGGELVGNPLPRDAQTGELDTPYTDTVASLEKNYYRFEVTPGTELRGEVIVDTGDVNCSAVDLDTSRIEVTLTDAAGEDLDETLVSNWLEPPMTIHTEPVVAEDDEVWLRVETKVCDGAFNSLELQVTEVE